MTFFIIIHNQTDRSFIVQLGQNVYTIPAWASRVFQCGTEDGAGDMYPMPVRIGWLMGEMGIGGVRRSIDTAPGSILTIKPSEGKHTQDNPEGQWKCDRESLGMSPSIPMFRDIKILADVSERAFAIEDGNPDPYFETCGPISETQRALAIADTDTNVLSRAIKALPLK